MARMKRPAIPRQGARESSEARASRHELGVVLQVKAAPTEVHMQFMGPLAELIRRVFARHPDACERIVSAALLGLDHWIGSAKRSRKDAGP